MILVTTQCKSIMYFNGNGNRTFYNTSRYGSCPVWCIQLLKTIFRSSIATPDLQVNVSIHSMTRQILFQSYRVRTYTLYHSLSRIILKSDFSRVILFSYIPFYFHKMFKCSKCGSLFNRKDNLNRHEKTHEGIRFPFVLCNYTFKYKPSLKRHEKTIHNNIMFKHIMFPVRTVPIVEVAQNNFITIAQDKLTSTDTSFWPDGSVLQFSVAGKFFL